MPLTGKARVYLLCLCAGDSPTTAAEHASGYVTARSTRRHLYRVAHAYPSIKRRIGMWLAIAAANDRKAELRTRRNRRARYADFVRCAP